jgi:hypothetical protein
MRHIRCQVVPVPSAECKLDIGLCFPVVLWEIRDSTCRPSGLDASNRLHRRTRLSVTLIQRAQNPVQRPRIVLNLRIHMRTATAGKASGSKLRKCRQRTALSC